MDFGRELWRALVAVAGGRGDLAEEGVAEAFSRYLVHRSHVRDPRAWLYRTGMRIVVAELRREARLAERGEEPAAYPSYVASDEAVEAMRRLTPEQRLATFLAYRMDLPLAEVARLTGTSVAGVKMRLVRARRTLAQELRQDAEV